MENIYLTNTKTTLSATNISKEAKAVADFIQNNNYLKGIKGDYSFIYDQVMKDNEVAFCIRVYNDQETLVEYQFGSFKVTEKKMWLRDKSSAVKELSLLFKAALFDKANGGITESHLEEMATGNVVDIASLSAEQKIPTNEQFLQMFAKMMAN